MGKNIVHQPKQTRLGSTSKRAILCLALGLNLQACTNLEPTYQRPTLPVASNWSPEPAVTTKENTPLTPGPEAGWKTCFTHPELQRLINLALANNRDLRVAAKTVERVQAQYRISSADRIPSINLSGSAERERSSINDRGFTQNAYTVGLGLTAFELDFFGRIRNLEQSALEQYLASEAAHQSAKISLISEVASHWARLIANQQRLELAKNTEQSREATLKLALKRFKIGLAEELDVYQSDSALQSARAEVANLSRVVAQLHNSMRFIVGTDVANALTDADASVLLNSISPPDTTLGSEILLSRPDVMQAEHTLRAASANIGAARAAFFPRITLTGLSGASSNDLASLFDSPTRAWQFLPQVSLPIFDSGRTQSQLDIAKIDRDIAISEYESAIQSAFREVADALAGLSAQKDQLEAQQKLTRAAEKSYQAAQKRYKKGLDNYLTLLDAQRTLFSAQQTLVAVKLDKALASTDLYKAIGGIKDPQLLIQSEN